MDMAYCVTCGTQIPDGVMQCNTCVKQRPIVVHATAQNVAPPAQKGTVTFALSLIFSILGIIAGIVGMVFCAVTAVDVSGGNSASETTNSSDFLDQIMSSLSGIFDQFDYLKDFVVDVSIVLVAICVAIILISAIALCRTISHRREARLNAQRYQALYEAVMARRR